MRLYKNILATLIIIFSFAAVTFSQPEEETGSAVKNPVNEENYLSGLSSNNEELRVNSAYMLGKMKSQKAVIPLMDMFRKEKDDGAKLVAALSLLRIGDARGIFLLKRSIDLREDNGMAIILQHLYKDYKSKTKEIMD